MSVHASEQDRRTRLRLTRRGRIVLGALLTVVVAALLAIAAMFGATHAAASDAASGEAASGQNEFGYVVVLPGESLWSVAGALDPSTDPREIIAEIVSLNQLQDSSVQAGQPIAVPLRYSDAPGVVPASELGIGA